jgi:two-component system chemotaxis response regulator CheY
VAKILVVEDDASLRTVIRLVLEQADHEVSEAPNGQSGLDQLQHSAPDLILVDSKMPVLTGTEFIGRLRAKPAYAGVPVVLLTGLPGSVPDAAADAVVAKPFEPEDLLRVIGGLLAAAG